jgi:hypothetical protein
MDRIIKTRREKVNSPNATLELHPKIYIWGKNGIGKTWTVRNSLENFVDLEYDILKSRNATLEFIERIKVSGLPVLIDDYDSVSETIGMKEINALDRVIIIGNSPVKKLDGFYMWEFPTKTLAELTEIAKLYDVVDEDIVRKSGGDIRCIISSIGDDKDVFWTPKDFVRSMICKDGSRDAGDYIGRMIEEHGHVMDMIFDNYIDSEADPNDVLECLSRASIYDDVIYAGNWNLLPYFSIEACIYPSHYIDHTVKGDIRPGSMWTKFSNMCMRRKKFRDLSTRVHRQHLDVDAIMLFRDYFEKGLGQHLIKEYNLKKSDFDVINHLCLQRKLKTSVITALKKQCLE